MSEENNKPAENEVSQSAPEAPEPAEKKPLSDKKKTALLRYMAILFAAAFVLVLVSLVLQMHNSQQTISELNETKSNALTNAEQLQAQNRELQQDKTDLQSQLDDLQKQLDDEKAMNEDLQKASDDAEAQLTATQEENQRAIDYTKEAYDALMVAVSATTKEGNVTYSKAMDSLKLLHIYLSESACEIYKSLLTE